MSFEPREYLRHVLVEAEYLSRVLAGLTRDEFDRDEPLQRAQQSAVSRSSARPPGLSLRIYGPRHQISTWRRIAGMRDRLIHAYFGVDYDLVWDVLTDRIPSRKAPLEAMLGRQ